MVPSATADLVEHVFEEHGDPAADEAEQPDSDDTEARSEGDSQESDPPNAETTGSSGNPAEEDASEEESASDPADDERMDVPLEDLTDRQRELLEEVATRPEATQAEIADHFDVTRATVSRWASDIEGFEWRDRADVVAQAFDTPSTAVSTDGGPTAETAPVGTEAETPTIPDGADGDLAARLDALESRLGELESAGSEDDAAVDVELAHKVAHACLQSDAISDDEELRILEWLMN